jgi:hypothetical protein
LEKETSHLSTDAESGSSQRSGLKVLASLKMVSELWTKRALIPTIVCCFLAKVLSHGGKGECTSPGMTVPFIVAPFPEGASRGRTPATPLGLMRRDSFTTAVCMLLAKSH